MDNTWHSHLSLHCWTHSLSEVPSTSAKTHLITSLRIRSGFLGCSARSGQVLRLDNNTAPTESQIAEDSPRIPETYCDTHQNPSREAVKHSNQKSQFRHFIEARLAAMGVHQTPTRQPGSMLKVLFEYREAHCNFCTRLFTIK
ncbi:hypothetical protein CLF_100491, partial [Clonorchis sinensis]